MCVSLKMLIFTNPKLIIKDGNHLQQIKGDLYDSFLENNPYKSGEIVPSVKP